MDSSSSYETLPTVQSTHDKDSEFSASSSNESSITMFLGTSTLDEDKKKELVEFASWLKNKSYFKYPDLRRENLVKELKKIWENKNFGEALELNTEKLKETNFVKFKDPEKLLDTFMNSNVDLKFEPYVLLRIVLLEMGKFPTLKEGDIITSTRIGLSVRYLIFEANLKKELVKFASWLKDKSNFEYPDLRRENLVKELREIWENRNFGKALRLNTEKLKRTNFEKSKSPKELFEAFMNFNVKEELVPYVLLRIVLLEMGKSPTLKEGDIITSTRIGLSVQNLILETKLSLKKELVEFASWLKNKSYFKYKDLMRENLMEKLREIWENKNFRKALRLNTQKLKETNFVKFRHPKDLFEAFMNSNVKEELVPYVLLRIVLLEIGIRFFLKEGDIITSGQIGFSVRNLILRKKKRDSNASVASETNV